MAELSTGVIETYEHTVGIDLGDKQSQVCVLDSGGAVVEEACVATSQAGLRRKLAQLEPSLVVIEVGTHSRWVSLLAEALGHTCLVANAYRARRLAEGENKNDKLDAEALARFARSDPRLLKPIQHRGAEAASDLALVHSRGALVSSRTMLINRVRGVVKATGGRLPACDARYFHRKVAGVVPEALGPAVTPLLEIIAALTKQIEALDRRLERMIEERYPEAQHLQQVKGVGPLISLTYVLTIEEPARFKHSRDVGPYLGLTQRQWQSGQQSRQLGISKAGNRYLRLLLVQGAQQILGPHGADSHLRRWGLRKALGSKNAKRRAVIAVARKLAVLMHKLWTSGEAYEPLRGEPREVQAA
jgi:transposase